MEQSKSDIKKWAAVLESRLDYLETEMGNLDALLRACGFSNGIETLKSTMADLLHEIDRDDAS
ncbi:MAG: hypothetical protein A3F09_05195 [Chlamydiae bacterium RIFCSPHIGHO2_12_FULL_49_11]|nr:MAG: hypothetical protein A3F09_05195 [Chlamydiae bacterium RIFCSPHIGHO2_12_FULL_49_11]